jgi:hypothetical protein
MGNQEGNTREAKKLYRVLTLDYLPAYDWVIEKKPSHPYPEQQAMSAYATPTVFDIVRDCTLADSGLILDHVHAIEATYVHLTGRVLHPYEALRALDRILADRQGMADLLSPPPIPVELAPVAAFMIEQSYDPAAIHMFVRHVERTGMARCSGVLDSEDVSYVEAILDDIYTTAAVA